MNRQRDVTVRFKENKDCTDFPLIPHGYSLDPANTLALSPGDLTFSESSVFEAVPCRNPQQDPGLIPLPDASADSGLDWSDLVDAAKAFEGIQASLNLFVQKSKLQNALRRLYTCF